MKHHIWHLPPSCSWSLDRRPGRKDGTLPKTYSRYLSCLFYIYIYFGLRPIYHGNQCSKSLIIPVHFVAKKYFMLWNLHWNRTVLPLVVWKRPGFSTGLGHLDYRVYVGSQIRSLNATVWSAASMGCCWNLAKHWKNWLKKQGFHW